MVREGNKPSLLDLIITNEENMVDNIVHLPGLGVSDHLVLTCDFNCYIDRINSMSNKLNFFKGDYKSMEDQLSKQDWNLEMSGLG